MYSVLHQRESSSRDLIGRPTVSLYLRKYRRIIFNMESSLKIRENIVSLQLMCKRRQCMRSLQTRIQKDTQWWARRDTQGGKEGVIEIKNRNYPRYLCDGCGNGGRNSRTGFLESSFNRQEIALPSTDALLCLCWCICHCTVMVLTGVESRLGTRGQSLPPQKAIQRTDEHQRVLWRNGPMRNSKGFRVLNFVTLLVLTWIRLWFWEGRNGESLLCPESHYENPRNVNVSEHRILLVLCLPGREV